MFKALIITLMLLVEFRDDEVGDNEKDRIYFFIDNSNFNICKTFSTFPAR